MPVEDTPSHKLPAEPSAYQLVQVRDEESIRFTREKNSAAWRGRLSEEQYIERETVLSKSKIANWDKKKLRVFILSEKGKPDVKVGSLELLVRPSWQYDFNSETGKVERKGILAGTIGGVYTYEDYRGKGLAKIMVDKLQEMSENEFVGPDGFTFLYSEIKQYYVQNGFTSFRVPLIKVPFGTTDISQVNGDYQYDYLKFHEFEDMFKIHNEQFDQELVAKVLHDKKSRVSVNPDASYVDWFHLRAKFISSKVFYEDSEGICSDNSKLSYDEILEKFHKVKPDVFGVKISSKKDGEFVGGIVWTYDWPAKPDEPDVPDDLPDEDDEAFKAAEAAKNPDPAISNACKVIKIVVNKDLNRDDITKQLIIQMKSYVEAADKANPPKSPLSGFKKFEIWQSEISDDIVQWLTKDFGGKPNLKNPSRSAILHHKASDNDKIRNGDIIWEGNDKLPWF